VLLVHGTPENVQLRYFILEYSATHEANPSTVLGEWLSDGTYVNHDRVESGPVVDGDEIQVGRFVLIFRVGASGGA